jgi:hypothetical protein
MQGHTGSHPGKPGVCQEGGRWRWAGTVCGFGGREQTRPSRHAEARLL